MDINENEKEWLILMLEDYLDYYKDYSDDMEGEEKEEFDTKMGLYEKLVGRKY